MENIVIIKANNIIRIYNKKEVKKYNNEKYITEQELRQINLMQFLMQRQNKVIKSEAKI